MLKVSPSSFLKVMNELMKLISIQEQEVGNIFARHVFITEIFKEINSSKKNIEKRLKEMTIDSFHDNLFSAYAILTTVWFFIFFFYFIPFSQFLTAMTFIIFGIDHSLYPLFLLYFLSVSVVIWIYPAYAPSSISLSKEKTNIDNQLSMIDKNLTREKKFTIIVIYLKKVLLFIPKMPYKIITFPHWLSRNFMVKFFLGISYLIARFQLHQKNKKTKDLREEIEEKENTLTILGNMLLERENELITRDESFRRFFERDLENVIYSLPKAMIQIMRFLVFDRIKDLDDFEMDIIERFVLAAASGNYLFDTARYEELALDPSMMIRLIDAMNYCKSNLNDNFLQTFENVLNEITRENWFIEGMSPEVLFQVLEEIKRKIPAAKKDLNNFLNLLKILQDNPDVMKEQTRFSDDLEKIKNLLEEAPQSESSLKSKLTIIRTIKANKSEYIRFLALIDDDIVMINTPRGTYYTLSKNLLKNKSFQDMDTSKENLKDIDTLKKELKMLTSQELELKKNIISRMMLKLQSLQGKIETTTVKERLERLELEKNLIEEIISERKTFTEKLQIDQVTCPNCNSKINSGDNRCPKCKKKLTRCMICSLIIDEASDDSRSCPHCGSFAHFNEFKNWIKEHEKCPMCKEKLTVSQIV